MRKCNYDVNIFPEDDEDGRCLASATFLVTFRRKSDGHIRHCPRWAEHRDFTNEMWEKVKHE